MSYLVCPIALEGSTKEHSKSCGVCRFTVQISVLSLKGCRHLQILLPSSVPMVRDLGFVHEVEAPAATAAVHFIGLQSNQALED